MRVILSMIQDVSCRMISLVVVDLAAVSISMNMVGVPYKDVQPSSATALTLAAASKEAAGRTIVPPWITWNINERVLSHKLFASPRSGCLLRSQGSGRVAGGSRSSRISHCSRAGVRSCRRCSRCCGGRASRPWGCLSCQM